MEVHESQGHDLEGFTLHGFPGTLPGKSMSVGPRSPATLSHSRSWSLMSLPIVAMERTRFLHKPNPKCPDVVRGFLVRALQGRCLLEEAHRLVGQRHLASACWC